MSITTETRQSTGWTADASTFGARLALIRQRMGWSNVARAARACGIPVDSWRNWEVDGREPHRRTTIAKQIAGVTGCDYLWLVHGPGYSGGEGLNARYDPLAERVIATIGSPTNRTGSRPKVRRPNRRTPTASPVRPTRRRAEPIGSPNRAELATV